MRLGPTTSLGNTSTGVGVSVAAGAGFTAIVNFDSVIQPGVTNVAQQTYTSTPPAGFRVGTPSLLYDVTTSATFAGTIRVTLPFSPAMFHHPAEVRIFHLEGGIWVDRTLAVNAAGSITAATTSLSPFLILEPLDRAPVAVASDIAVSATAAAGTQVKLDGTHSTDADGDSLTYRWTGPFPEGGGTVTGASPTVTLPAGASKISLIVNDGEVDSPAVSLTATVADFQVNTANTSLTLKSGQSATVNLNVTSLYGAFANSVALSCANLPAGYTCRFSPGAVVPGAAGATITLTIGPATIANHHHTPLWPWTLTAAGLVLGGASTRRKKWLVLLLVGLALCATMIACGGGGMTSQTTTTTTTPPPVPSSTTVVTLSATSGSVTHSATLTLNIQQQ
jgi:hypothetical protein